MSGVLRGLLLALVWVALAGFASDYAIYGVVSVAAGTALSLVLLPPRRDSGGAGWFGRLWGSVLLAGWFLWQSAQGGVDVARRSVARVPDIDPEVVTVPVALPEGGGRQVALLMMNLMPGTMVQRGPRALPDGSECIELHTLSAALEPAAQWGALQLRAARAAGVEL